MLDLVKAGVEGDDLQHMETNQWKGCRYWAQCLEQCTHLKTVSITDDQPVLCGSSNQTPIRAEAWQRAAEGKALTEVLHARSKIVGSMQGQLQLSD